MLIILSPAKTMNMSRGELALPGTQPMFDAEAEFLAHKMAHYSASELETLLKISPKLAQINYERYQQFDVPKPLGSAELSCKQALYAYDGSVFKAIAPQEFTAADLAYAQDRVRIISTLYGLVRPLDQIKAYRIAFNLKIDGLPGNLYDYWHGKLTDSLIHDTQQVGGVLVNLASLDVQAALAWSQLQDQLTIITPEFKELKNGKYEVIRTYAKIARGAMTRYIIQHRAQTPHSLQAFTWRGYAFNPALSDATNYIYTRG